MHPFHFNDILPVAERPAVTQLPSAVEFCHVYVCTVCYVHKQAPVGRERGQMDFVGGMPSCIHRILPACVICLQMCWSLHLIVQHYNCNCQLKLCANEAQRVDRQGYPHHCKWHAEEPEYLRETHRLPHVHTYKQSTDHMLQMITVH